MENSINLCSNRCCPTIAREGELWIITDDYDGRVRLTDEELESLIKAKDELTEKRLAIALEK